MKRKISPALCSNQGLYSQVPKIRNLPFSSIKIINVHELKCAAFSTWYLPVFSRRSCLFSPEEVACFLLTFPSPNNYCGFLYLMVLFLQRDHLSSLQYVNKHFLFLNHCNSRNSYEVFLDIFKYFKGRKKNFSNQNACIL